MTFGSKTVGIRKQFGDTPAERIVKQQTTYDVLTSLNGPKKPFSLIMTDIGVDPRLTAVVNEAIKDHMISILKQNDKVEQGFSMHFDPKQINKDGYLQTFLSDLHTKNPKVYNDTIGWL